MASARGTNEEERNPFYIPDVGKVRPGSIGSMYGVPSKNKEPEYIPYNPRGRDVTGRLFFNSGAFWLGGFTLGSLYGAKEGYSSAASPIARIRFNSVMNAMSKRGSHLGNNLGVIAFYHTSFIYLADVLELENLAGGDLRAKSVTPIFAGFLTGALFKCTSGPRGAALAGSFGTIASCVYWFGGSYVSDILLGRGGRY